MEKILVLDFGGQYNQLIARRVRDLKVYAEILPYTTPLEEIAEGHYQGIIFTGGPNSVYDPESPHYPAEILDLGIPILGICYGAQLMAYMLGGTIEHAEMREYGRTEVTARGKSRLFAKIPKKSMFWMSHTDYISRIPEGFAVSAVTKDCPCAAMELPEKQLYAVQFHPEKTLAEGDETILPFFRAWIHLTEPR